MKSEEDEAFDDIARRQGGGGFQAKRQAAMDKLQEPNTITFSTSSADWVMRITADRRIEVNEGVEVTEAAKKVLEAMQWMLKPAQEPKRPWVGLTEQEQGAIMEDLNAHGTRLYEFARAIEAKLKEKNNG